MDKELKPVGEHNRQRVSLYFTPRAARSRMGTRNLNNF